MDPKRERDNTLKQHQLVMEEYAAVRKNLTKREVFFFDKAMTLLEEIAEEEGPSERTLVLSTGIMAGVCASRMTKVEYVTLSVGLGTAVLKARIIGGIHGRRNSD